ncbi:hypothetical protein [Streptomyces sp. SJL17-1]|uniref:hypothetical protein n=1 Tax=Streptomyces sp. SJL17-1 TaxID=2967223 RepID=UPI002966B9AC|nr:hypothetical protein [Streptomyces sp. SJL17-1]
MEFSPTNLAAAMKRRESATEELRKLVERGIRTDADRQREDTLLTEVRDADNAVREAVSNGVHHEDQRAAGVFFRTPGDAVAKRSLADVRIFGTAFAEMREADYVADTSSVPAAAMLAAAPNGSKLLGRLNAFPFSKTRGAVPVAPRVTADLQPRNEPIADVAVPVTVGSFNTAKPAAITRIARDSLTDYPAAEKSIEAALLSGVGQRVDWTLVNGALADDETVLGLLDVGVTTTAPAGKPPSTPTT